MAHSFDTRKGFTLIEALVAMAVIGILVALVTPAVQAARGAARRMVCQNQLRQLGLALHNYYDGHGCFPAGSYVMGPSFPMQSGWGWGSMILPFAEQKSLYDRIDFGNGTAVGANLVLIAESVAVWRCPSEIAPQEIDAVPVSHPSFQIVAGNYCGSEGILSPMSCVRFGDITDGASQTLLLGERVVQAGGSGTLGFTSAWCGQVAFQDGYEYRSIPHLEASPLHPINSSTLDAFCFGSRHTGGANFIRGDGSALFLNENIDVRVFEALGTADGGEVIDLP